MTSTGAVFVCGACSATFTSRKHLRRHSGTHSAERPHKCVFCDAAFKRRDVLRKHFRSCATRLILGQEMPRESLPGKPVKSCDHCALSKKACDQALPCANCLSRNQACMYNRATSQTWHEPGNGRQNELEQPAIDACLDLGFDFLEAPTMDLADGLSDSTTPEWWSWQQARPSLPINEGLSHPMPRNIDPPSPSPWRIQQGYKFNFLLNFTRTSGLRSAFNFPQQREGSLTSANLSAQADALVELGWDSFRTESFSSWMQSDTDSRLQNELQAYNADDQISEMELVIQWLDDPLFVRTQELLKLFRSNLSPALKNSAIFAGKGESFDTQCLEFLSPPKIKRFVELFFDQWYPHCPILHKPTFDMAIVPALLLAPVILMGACMSDDKDEQMKGRLYAEHVEKLIFSHPLLSLYSSCTDVHDIDLSPVKVIQAAYLMCLLQNWEGDDAAKKRIRQYRFITLVATARDIGFSCATHNLRSPDAFKWSSFVEREETIRTLTYIFLLDSAFLIFNNAPPKLMLQELEMDLTCPEEIFQAESAKDCHDLWQFHQLRIVSNPWGSFSVVGAIEALSSTDDSPMNAELFSKMTILNLFTIISGLHTILFQHRTLFLCPSSSSRQIRLVIARWKAAWGERDHAIYHDVNLRPWQKIGFIRNANEYACLALARLNDLEAHRERQASKSVLSNAHATFERLDERSMSQVTNLMLSLTVADD